VLIIIVGFQRAIKGFRMVCSKFTDVSIKKLCWKNFLIGQKKRNTEWFYILGYLQFKWFAGVVSDVLVDGVKMIIGVEMMAILSYQIFPLFNMCFSNQKHALQIHFLAWWWYWRTPIFHLCLRKKSWYGIHLRMWIPLFPKIHIGFRRWVWRPCEW